MYLLIGQIQASRDRPEDAIAAYQEAVKRQSQPVAADAALASISLRTGAFDQAATYSQQALAIQSGNPALLALRVRVLLAQGKTSQAKDEIAGLEKRYPNSPTVLDLLAAEQFSDRQVEAARVSYTRAAALAPRDLEALTGLVRIDLATGHKQEALSRVEATLKGGKPSGEFLMVAGRAYASAGNQPKAEEMLQRAIETEPSRLEAYGLLGALYAAEHRLADAEDQFRRVTTENPKSVAAGTMLGMILEAENRGPDAEKQYKAVLAADNRAAVAANNLAWIYVASNRNLDEALQLAQTAARRLPDDSHVNDTLGWVYYRKDMAAQALPYLEASVKKDPSDPAAYYHLGMAYVGTGDLADGKKSLQSALATKSDFDGAVEAKKHLGRHRRLAMPVASPRACAAARPRDGLGHAPSFERLARTLWILFTLFIVYGTTIPFDFRVGWSGAMDKLAHLPLNPLISPDSGQRVSIPDEVQNVLLFIPFGAFGVLAGRSRRRASIPRLISVTGMALALSASVETLQLFSAVRVTSVGDVTTNVTGAILGGVAAIAGRGIFERLIRRLQAAGLTNTETFYPAMIFTVLLCAAAWEPFDVTLDVGSFVGKLKMLHHDVWQYSGVLSDEGVEVIRYGLFAIFGASWLNAIGRGQRAAVEGPPRLG